MNAAPPFPEDRTIFFVGGQGKSGTTWVQLLLDAHPDISCRGEAHFFDRLAPAMNGAFAKYRRELQENNALFQELPGYALPEQAQAFAALRGAVISAMIGQPGSQDARALGERTPANVEHLGLIWELFPQGRFIHVIRDPRDVAVSLWHHGERIHEGVFPKQYGSLDKLAVQLCSSWTAWMQRVSALGAERPGQYLEVRYEDLLDHGDIAMTRMLEFLGIAPESAAVSRCLEATSFANLSGGRARGEEDRSSHFRKGVSGDWREQLTDSTRKEIAVSEGAQLTRLGYPPD